MGFLFAPRPKLAYVPPPGNARPTLLGNPNSGHSADSVASTPPPKTAVLRNLPGLGPNYLDSEFAPKVDTFIDNARRQGVNSMFTSGYRSPEHNQELMDHPGAHGVASSAAKDSLHMAGLAVDVVYKDLDDATKTIISNPTHNQLH